MSLGDFVKFVRGGLCILRRVTQWSILDPGWARRPVRPAPALAQGPALQQPPDLSKSVGPMPSPALSPGSYVIYVYRPHLNKGFLLLYQSAVRLERNKSLSRMIKDFNITLDYKRELTERKQVFQYALTFYVHGFKLKKTTWVGHIASKGNLYHCTRN